MRFTLPFYFSNSKLCHFDNVNFLDSCSAEIAGFLIKLNIFVFLKILIFMIYRFFFGGFVGGDRISVRDNRSIVKRTSDLLVVGSFERE